MTDATARRPMPWLLIGLAVPALFILLGLGTWQVQRLAWKEALLADIEVRLDQPPLAVEDLAGQLATGTVDQSAIDYRPATATGTFDHAGEAHFFATHKGVSGYYIYTPLQLADGRSVFVNRGFVPFELKEVESRPQTLVPGIVRVDGLARQRLDDKPSWIVPDNDPRANIHYWKDLSLMVSEAGLQEAQVLPFFLDAGSPRAPGQLGDWPVSGVTQINLPNNHLQYALTWYGLALTLIVVLVVFIRRRPT